MIPLLQTTTASSEACASDPKCVYLDPEQLNTLATQMQGNTFYLAAFLGMIVFCVGLMALVMIVGGR